MGRRRYHQYRYIRQPETESNHVANEAVFNGWMSEEAQCNFIKSATHDLRAAGFTGVISTVETVGTYQAHPSLCAAVESVVHANIHAYFDPGTDSSEAGSFVVSQRTLLANLCGKSVIVSETGWPSEARGNQQAAIEAIRIATKGDVTFFSYKDDHWKVPGVEQHFGMFLISPIFKCVR